MPDVVAGLAPVLRLWCTILRSGGRVQRACVRLPWIERLAVMPRLGWVPMAMILRYLILRYSRSAWR